MPSKFRAGVACLAILTLVLAPAAVATELERAERPSVFAPFFGALDWLLQQLDSAFDNTTVPSDNPPPEDPPPNDPPPDPDPEPDPDDERGPVSDPGG